MALRLEVQDETPDGSFSEIDLTEERIGRFRLQLSYTHAARLTFVILQPQFTLPIGLKKFIRLWDDDADDQDGNPFSDENPIFEGFIEEMEPKDNLEISVAAYDPTYKSAQDITVMSFEWDEPEGGNPPEEGFGTYPRLVLNVSIYNDPDYAISRSLQQSVGQMIATILSDQYHPLAWINAAPDDDDAFESGDLSPLDFQPQEKQVFESEGVRSCIERLLQWMPAYKLHWHPGTRKWRIRNVLSSPQETITLNDYSGDHRVMTAELHRSLEGRRTAVKYYGPESIENRTVSVTGGGLTDLSGSSRPLETGVDGRWRWQITDEDRRRVARLLAESIHVAGPEYQIHTSAWWQPFWTSRSAVLQVRYEETSAGTDRWQAVFGWQLDSVNGIIEFPNGAVYRYNDNPELFEPNHENPVDVRFIYGSFTEPISARYPSEGFEGTAFDLAGVEVEEKLYDEMLAMGYLFGTPVTTQTRIEQFEKLAQYQHAMLKDVIYTGNLVLDGMQYDFHKLDKRINIAAVDEDGETLATGLEEARMILTDVEYDFEEDTTTLSMSSDHMEVIGIDVESAKNSLKIRASELRTEFRVNFQHFKRIVHTDFGNRIVGIDTVVTVDPFVFFVDAETGHRIPGRGIRP